jgi:hypothetical protein
VNLAHSPGYITDEAMENAAVRLLIREKLRGGSVPLNGIPRYLYLAVPRDE